MTNTKAALCSAGVMLAVSGLVALLVWQPMTILPAAIGATWVALYCGFKFG